MTLRNDEGFTLVELMMVVAIIAILVAVAIPIFAGARARAQRRTAQNAARDAVVVARTVQPTGDYSGVDAIALGTVEPSYTFVTGASSSSGPKTVSVEAVAPTTLVVAVFSESGQCMWIRDSVDPTIASLRYATTPSDGTDCTAASPPADAAFASSWD